jgi:N-succinyldiaminopimelate aminotransferase
VNPDLERLQPYPFERLAALLAGVEAPADRAVHRLSVGEPQHAPPRIVEEALRSSLDLLSRYPSTRGDASLRESQAAWLRRRHGLRKYRRGAAPAAGQRYARGAVCHRPGKRSARLPGRLSESLLPDLRGAALLAGADVVFLDTRPENGFLPDPECSEQHPVAGDGPPVSLFAGQSQRRDHGPHPAHALHRARARARRAAGQRRVLLGTLPSTRRRRRPASWRPAEAGPDLSYRNCLSMHSLSKRSNLPGLRSGSSPAMRTRSGASSATAATTAAPCLRTTRWRAPWPGMMKTT